MQIQLSCKYNGALQPDFKTRLSRRAKYLEDKDSNSEQ